MKIINMLVVLSLVACAQFAEAGGGGAVSKGPVDVPVVPFNNVSDIEHAPQKILSRPVIVIALDNKLLESGSEQVSDAVIELAKKNVGTQFIIAAGQQKSESCDHVIKLSQKTNLPIRLTDGANIDTCLSSLSKVSGNVLLSSSFLPKVQESQAERVFSILNKIIFVKTDGGQFTIRPNQDRSSFAVDPSSGAKQVYVKGESERPIGTLERIVQDQSQKKQSPK